VIADERSRENAALRAPRTSARTASSTHRNARSRPEGAGKHRRFPTKPPHPSTWPTIQGGGAPPWTRTTPPSHAGYGGAEARAIKGNPSARDPRLTQFGPTGRAVAACFCCTRLAPPNDAITMFVSASARARCRAACESFVVHARTVPSGPKP
jgi:hypothetical protein